jgi:hypothetical protein
LSLAIDIFTDRYPQKFLHQLVSGQLDMDRMDYLNRDSFFTGVSEGVIGYDRIIKMLAVHNGELVVEEKGIYSIEKFLVARRLMYWQVYLHKTGVTAEQMLIHTLQRARELALQGIELEVPRHLGWFLYQQPGATPGTEELIRHFTLLDDNDITAAIKYWSEDSDPTLSYLSRGLLDRRLLRLEWHDKPISPEKIEQTRKMVTDRFGSDAQLEHLVYFGSVSNRAYDENTEQIKILFKNGQVCPISECSDVPLFTKLVTKHFICYPKHLDSAS